MDSKKFEILLKKDRNWLSKYGGFISLTIITFLIIGIIYIKVPQYQYVNTINNTVSPVKIKKSDYFTVVGDTIVLKNSRGKILTLVVDSIYSENENNTLHFKVIKGDLSLNDYRFIIEEQSLLETLIAPFIKR